MGEYPIHEDATCVVCLSTFMKTPKGRPLRRRSSKVRPINSVTCSDKCAKFYGKLGAKERNKLKEIKDEYIKNKK